MNSEEFARVFEEQVRASREMLLSKAEEYAQDDERLHNFIVAGGLQGQTPAQALGGMMAKHTVSVYDMIDRDDEGLQDLAKWEEKITDHINYLILLKACVVQKMKDEEIDTNQYALFKTPSEQVYDWPITRTFAEGINANPV